MIDYIDILDKYQLSSLFVTDLADSKTTIFGMFICSVTQHRKTIIWVRDVERGIINIEFSKCLIEISMECPGVLIQRIYRPPVTRLEQTKMQFLKYANCNAIRNSQAIANAGSVNRIRCQFPITWYWRWFLGIQQPDSNEWRWNSHPQIIQNRIHIKVTRTHGNKTFFTRNKTVDHLFVIFDYN